ncbi:hypothetical protein [Tolypothrix sp. VBCCA 56010]|uniref:hypothetical protein n=1 Tax=Tolypothrix sp. VBCCA 56010 TaxID=3137731 RepID=UPI003D7D4651
MSPKRENEHLKKYKFTTEREEALTAKLTIRIAPSKLEKLKTLENYPEFVRQAIDKALNELEKEN